jgi:two-component system, cell cycle sensor histidine kinase and response regulator CckA
VLLVEDEDAVRAFAARALRNKGYTVIEAASGEQALALPPEQLDRVELLISDVVMPNLDGPTLAAQLRSRRPDLKILFISGYAEDSLRNNKQYGEIGRRELPAKAVLARPAGRQGEGSHGRDCLKNRQ